MIEESKRLISETASATNIKLTLLGDTYAGKSSLIETYTTGQFVVRFEPTVMDKVETCKLWNGKDY